MVARAWFRRESLQYQVITNDQGQFGHTKLIYLRVDKLENRVLASPRSSPGEPMRTAHHLYFSGSLCLIMALTACGGETVVEPEATLCVPDRAHLKCTQSQPLKKTAELVTVRSSTMAHRSSLPITMR